MGHPLFPSESAKGVTYEGIERIRVTRWADGTFLFARRVFGAEELRSEEDIFNLFGGGNYEIIALNADEDKIIVRRKFQLRGKRLPLNAEDDEDNSSADDRRASKNGNGETSLVELMMNMQQQMITFFSTLVQSSKEESRALIESSKIDARAMAAMAAQTSEMQLRVMSDFFGKSMELAKSAPSGGASEGQFSPEQLLELGSALADARNDSISDTVGKLADTFKFAVEAKQKQRAEASSPDAKETGNAPSHGQPVA